MNEIIALQSNLHRNTTTMALQKPYFFHRFEWVLAVVALVCLITFRVSLLESHESNQIFGDNLTSHEVKRTVRWTCVRDVQLLCHSGSEPPIIATVAGTQTSPLSLVGDRTWAGRRLLVDVPIDPHGPGPEKVGRHFLTNQEYEACLWHHYQKNSLITDACQRAVKLAPTKIAHLELVGAMDPDIDLYIIIFVAFVAVLAVAVGFAPRRQGHSVSGKRRFQQVLDDPLLRRDIERQVIANVGEEGLVDFMEKLQKKAATFDPVTASVEQRMHKVRRLRLLLLVLLVANIFLATLYRDRRMTSLYAEILILGTFIASYLERKTESKDNPITKPLLSDGDHGSDADTNIAVV